MDERYRHTAEECAAERIQQREEPAVALATIDPDQDPPSGLDRAGHSLQRPLRFFEVMDDADRKDDVETIGKGQIVGTRALNPHCRKTGEVAAGDGERAVID